MSRDIDRLTEQIQQLQIQHDDLQQQLRQLQQQQQSNAVAQRRQQQPQQQSQTVTGTPFSPYKVGEKVRIVNFVKPVVGTRATESDRIATVTGTTYRDGEPWKIWFRTIRGTSTWRAPKNLQVISEERFLQQNQQHVGTATGHDVRGPHYR